MVHVVRGDDRWTLLSSVAAAAEAAAGLRNGGSLNAAQRMNKSHRPICFVFSPSWLPALPPLRPVPRTRFSSIPLRATCAPVIYVFLIQAVLRPTRRRRHHAKATRLHPPVRRLVSALPAAAHAGCRHSRSARARCPPPTAAGPAALQSPPTSISHRTSPARDLSLPLARCSPFDAAPGVVAVSHATRSCCDLHDACYSFCAASKCTVTPSFATAIILLYHNLLLRISLYHNLLLLISLPLFPLA